MPEPGEKARRRAARELVGNLSRPEGTASAAAGVCEHGEQPDWWAAGEPRRR
jgi:hypothetical protein